MAIQVFVAVYSKVFVPCPRPPPERKCGHVYLTHMVQGESEGLSVHMTMAIWPQVTGSGSHEPSGYVPYTERQLADVFLIHHRLPMGMGKMRISSLNFGLTQEPYV